MDIWTVVIAIHLLAMAFFVGGQLFLAAVVVPTLKGTDAIAPVARRFANASLIALLLSIVTGFQLASHFELWGSTALQIKLALLVVVFGLIAWHMQAGASKPWLHPIIAVLSLTLVVLGTSLAH